MTPLNTLNHLIEEFEADLEDISLEIRETTNYETIHISQDKLRGSVILQLNYEWDEKKQHLDNLKEIKRLLGGTLSKPTQDPLHNRPIHTL
jgi:hypothetical protein